MQSEEMKLAFQCLEWEKVSGNLNIYWVGGRAVLTIKRGDELYYLSNGNDYQKAILTNILYFKKKIYELEPRVTAYLILALVEEPLSRGSELYLP